MTKLISYVFKCIVDFTCKVDYTIKKEEHFIMETLSNIVKELRTQKEISQGKLAELVGVTRQTIISLEKGSYVPSLILAMRISEVLEMPIEQIFKKETV